MPVSPFHEVQLPSDIAEGATGGPMHSTIVVTTANGAEQRIGQWSRARLRYEISLNDRTPVQLQVLVAFFRARKGKLYGFRFKDWTDFQLTNEPLTNPSPGSTAQLTKLYTSGIGSELRNITKPVNGTLTLKRNTVAQTEGVNFTVDYTTGIVTFLTGIAGGDIFIVTCEFDVPVRFDTDTMNFTQEATTVQAWGGVPIVEIAN